MLQKNGILRGKEMLILRCEIGSFSECSRSGSTYESCFPGTDVCIWRGLFNDSYVNCPVNCFDEEQCYRAPGKLSEVRVSFIYTFEKIVLICKYVMFFGVLVFG